MFGDDLGFTLPGDQRLGHLISQASYVPNILGIASYLGEILLEKRWWGKQEEADNRYRHQGKEEQGWT